MTDPEIVDVLGNILVGAPDDRANAALDAAISRLSAACFTCEHWSGSETRQEAYGDCRHPGLRERVALATHFTVKGTFGCVLRTPRQETP